MKRYDQPSTHAADRAVLADFLNHRPEDCDAAATRLATSTVPCNRQIAVEWLSIRKGEAK